jgi:hypothetical protein
VFLPSLQESPWKRAQYSPSRESLGWGCCFLDSQGTNHTRKDGEEANPWASPFGT